MKKLTAVFVCLLLLVFAGSSIAEDWQQKLQDINKKLEPYGLMVLKAEFLEMAGDSALGGRTVYANDRQMHLTSQWVPGDPRNGGGSGLTYMLDQTYAGSLSGFDANTVIDDTFQVWADEIQSGKLNINQLPDTGLNHNYVLTLYGLTGEPLANPLYADIVVTGFVGPGILQAPTLGVTFTLIWAINGVPTDINNDGYADTAIKEIWYNNGYNWQDATTTPGVDFYTVSVHENGHALGLGHFGTLWINAKNGKIYSKPRAVMNAVYLGVMRALRTTDKGSLNSIYNDWPK